MTLSNFNLQPHFLEDEIVKLIPLEENHFEDLFKAASDPLIWEQHPAKDRSSRDGFKTFFDAGLNSKGAFLILDKQSNEIIGTTRYYDYKPNNSSVAIGYTFLIRKFWGGSHNNSTKKLLINYAFQYVNSIFFHVGAENFRSQKAVLKLGAKKINVVLTTMNGISISPHFEYELKK
ncbi:RimJ/RimL family protein N-acetyltransferase [Flavobacterium sp. 2755]|uniref:GNAT family N-acetyltransferase n=1 Tax=Flavobacterium sp. 2755 TaxID=2817765 RepID=UPI00285B1FFD|nr:GNAT family N-acetyltransferase [Flavobacterium sp. 2755]MDR6760157.1 RimJ/RimL family protein N-acetyltransferase [Flavobacterium sp. 2755]